MTDKDVERRLIEMWNAGASSGVIADKLVLPVDYVRQAVQRLRKRGVPMRQGAPTKRHRVDGASLWS